MAGTLTRWDPFAELGERQTRFDRMFDELTDGRERAWTPAIDIERDNGNLVVRADIPGIKPEDVKIEVENNILTISGERKSEREDRKDGYYRVERAFGSFRRSLKLPEGVDPESVQASFERGVLEVHVPKPEDRKPRKVEISVGGEERKAIENSEPSDPAAA